MKVYTKFGDLGQTAILGDVCSKGSLRIDTYGTIDELLCALGVIYSSKNINLSIRRRVYEIVEILFEINVVLASFEYKEIDLSEKVCDLEYDIDSMSKKLSILTKFIVPYGNDSFHKLNNARVITRRAERLCVKLREEVDFSLSVLKYLNRLSDYLFICSRYCNDNEKYFK